MVGTTISQYKVLEKIGQGGSPPQVLHDQVVDAVLLSNVIEGLDKMGQRCPLRAHCTSGLRESGSLASSIFRSRKAGGD